MRERAMEGLASYRDTAVAQQRLQDPLFGEAKRLQTLAAAHTRNLQYDRHAQPLKPCAGQRRRDPMEQLIGAEGLTQVIATAAEKTCTQVIPGSVDDHRPLGCTEALRLRKKELGGRYDDVDTTLPSADIRRRRVDKAKLPFESGPKIP